MSAYIPLPQVTGGHLAQVTGGGGGGMGGVYVCEQRSVFPLLLIPHLWSLVLSMPIFIFYFNISQQCCILLGLLIQSQVDPSADLPIYSSLACMTDAYIFCV